MCKSTRKPGKTFPRRVLGGANGKIEPLDGCGQELLPQDPLKARGAVDLAKDSQVGSNEG